MVRWEEQGRLGDGATRRKCGPLNGCWKFLAKEMFTQNCNVILIAMKRRAIRPSLHLQISCGCPCSPPMVFARRPARSVKLQMSLPVCEIMCVWKTRDGYSPKIQRLI